MKTPSTLSPTLAIPTGLSRKGRQAALAIQKLLRQRGATDTGGCRAFYTPKEWLARGETYGQGAELILVYDGGDLRSFFQCEYGYARNEAMIAVLAKLGLYAEPCTGWYAAVYLT